MEETTAGQLRKYDLFTLGGKPDVYQVTSIGSMIASGKLWCGHTQDCANAVSLKGGDKVFRLSQEDVDSHKDHPGRVNTSGDPHLPGECTCEKSVHFHEMQSTNTRCHQPVKPGHDLCDACETSCLGT